MRIPTRLRSALVLAGAACLVSPAVAAAEPPVKLLTESQFGAKVNLNESDFCVGSECKPGGAEISVNPGGFGEVDPRGVAVNNHPGPEFGDIYTVDERDARVQVLTPTGGFVLMFGKEVNETTHGDICTQEEVVKGAKCKAGVQGPEAGAFGEAESIAVDPVTGDVYVSDGGAPGSGDARVDEYTETGQFVLMIGKEVNETKVGAVRAKGGTPSQVELEEENLCTAASGNVCKAGVFAVVGSAEHGAFHFAQNRTVLAAGGPSDLLYVGDEHRVQEFKPEGTWVHELSLTQISSAEETEVLAIAVDQRTGELYLTYYGPSFSLDNTIYSFDASDKGMGDIVVSPKEVGARIEIEAIALDSSGRLAVTAHEENPVTGINEWFGSLFHAETGEPITGFTLVPGREFYPNATSIAFNAGTVGAGEEMYAVANPRQEVVGYVPKIVAEPVTGALVCKEEGERETSVTLGCELTGEINPEGVENTETLFLWNDTGGALGGPGTQETSKQKVADASTLVPVAPTAIPGLIPNEPIHYELAGYDALVESPERFTGEEVSTVTPLVPPKIVGEPNASFVKSSSAVVSGELNPENAKTEDYFEYAPGEETLAQRCPNGVHKESCAGVASTTTEETSTYGATGTTLEATGLQPSTVYHYRLFAESENKTRTEKRTSLEQSSPEDEGSFTTAPAPIPQAQTGPPSMIGTTSATVSGEVNPDGQPATYAFELGVYNGAGTQYGVVFSGPAGTSSVLIEEELALTGLQPGTTYAYRIKITSGYGTQTGETTLFTTAGLPAVLEVPVTLPLVAVPAIAFPTGAKAVTTTKKATLKCSKGKKLNHGECVRVKTKKKAKKSAAHKSSKQRQSSK